MCEWTATTFNLKEAKQDISLRAEMRGLLTIEARPFYLA